MVVAHTHFEICTGCGRRRNVVALPVDFECGDPRCPIGFPVPPAGMAA
jgi:hypothetical protein